MANRFEYSLPSFLALCTMKEQGQYGAWTMVKEE